MRFYMLAQTVLVQNIALDQAKAQVSQLQQQVQQLQQHPQPAHTTSFLGRLLGEHDPSPQQQQQAPAPAYQPVPQYAPPHSPIRNTASRSISRRSTFPSAASRAFYAAPCRQPPESQPARSRLRASSRSSMASATAAYGFGGPGYGMGGFGMGERPVEETSSTTTTR